jgi:UTP--glucose-1-phosphate uridylyltransferase
MQVTKAVIPAAGLGTRFLPATKAVPKELLPIVDVPTIQYIVKEAADAGIKDIIFVIGRGKQSILDHFSQAPELEAKLTRDKNTELLEILRSTNNMANIISVNQSEPLGLGHAVLCAKDIIGNEPFAVMLGDDLVDAPTPCIKQMMDVFDERQKSIVALMRVSEDDVSKFGICGGEPIGERELLLDTMVEKPSPSAAPSNLAIVGRYILKPEIFSMIESTPPGRNGEIQLTDAMARMMAEDGFIGYEFTGDRYDAGDKFGFLQASIAFALKRRDIAPKLKAYLKELAL